MPKITVTAVIKTWCDVEVNASTLEEALEMSRKMRASDFIKYKGSCNDDSIKIVQVYDNDFEVEL